MHIHASMHMTPGLVVANTNPINDDGFYDSPPRTNPRTTASLVY